MKIAVDFQSVYGQRSGIGVFTNNLFEAIKKEDPGIEFLFFGKNRTRDMNALERILWESVEIPLRVSKEKPDLVYSPGFAPALWSPAPQVVTVHDLIGLIYPSNQRRISRIYWSEWQPYALKRARCLVADSESTRRDIVRLLGIPEGKIRVVTLSANSCFKKIEHKNEAAPILEKFKIKQPFIVVVGTLEPRKNLLRLLQAYQTLRQRGKNTFSLVFVGKPGGAERELYDYVKEKRLEEFVNFLGYLRDEGVVLLYNTAIGYAMVSLYEGFGLPALEAMSCGISGIVSDRSSLPEVAGNSAIYVDPENVEEMAEAMSVYASDDNLRQNLSTAAWARSKEFSSVKMAQSMLRIFKEEANDN